MRTLRNTVLALKAILGFYIAYVGAFGAPAIEGFVRNATAPDSAFIYVGFGHVALAGLMALVGNLD